MAVQIVSQTMLHAEKMNGASLARATKVKIRKCMAAKKRTELCNRFRFGLRSFLILESIFVCIG
jgi:hypothetical protein